MNAEGPGGRHAQTRPQPLLTPPWLEFTRNTKYCSLLRCYRITINLLVIMKVGGAADDRQQSELLLKYYLFDSTMKVVSVRGCSRRTNARTKSWSSFKVLSNYYTTAAEDQPQTAGRLHSTQSSPTRSRGAGPT
jgi:hypothetical protein